MFDAAFGSVARKNSSSNARTAARTILTVVAVEAWRVVEASMQAWEIVEAMLTGGSSLPARGDVKTLLTELMCMAWFGAEAIIQLMESMAGGCGAETIVQSVVLSS